MFVDGEKRIRYETELARLDESNRELAKILVALKESSGDIEERTKLVLKAREIVYGAWLKHPEVVKSVRIKIQNPQTHESLCRQGLSDFGRHRFEYLEKRLVALGVWPEEQGYGRELFASVPFPTYQYPKDIDFKVAEHVQGWPVLVSIGIEEPLVTNGYSNFLLAEINSIELSSHLPITPYVSFGKRDEDNNLLLLPRLDPEETYLFFRGLASHLDFPNLEEGDVLATKVVRFPTIDALGNLEKFDRYRKFADTFFTVQDVTTGDLVLYEVHNYPTNNQNFNDLRRDMVRRVLNNDLPKRGCRGLIIGMPQTQVFRYEGDDIIRRIARVPIPKNIISE